MTLRDDLIAAKALIDTPKKWFVCNSIVHALNDAVSLDDDDFIAARDHLRKVYGGPLIGASLSGHSQVMALFDRAIAAATENTGEAAK